MKCPKCQHLNDVGAKVCADCASPLTRTCVLCGYELQPTAKFCSECGRPTGLLVGSAGDGPYPQSGFGSPRSTPTHLAKRILESKSAVEGERKQVTVLFADLKASMELLAERDPEEARKLLDPVLDHMMEAVHRYEGTVNQTAGDGIMAIFGAPFTHEDHAVRACHAALRMQERVKRHAADVFHTHGVNIQIRVGVNSGEVVVGTVGSDLRMDYTAVGRTTHLAARMEQLASPGRVLLTPSTLALVENLVEVKALGAVPIKGLVGALDVYELRGMHTAQAGFHISTRRGLSPLVGREAELALLERAFERAANGDARIVGVVGEAGVGKSRLCSEFASRCRARGARVFEGRALSHNRTTPYALTSEVARAVFDISAHDAPDRAREKVVATIKTIVPELEADLPLLFDFLGLSEPGAESLRLDPTTRRERLIRATARLWRGAWKNIWGPTMTVLILEDLHWVDAGSASLIEAFIETLPGKTQRLVVINSRPEYAASWMKGERYEQISLSPLGQTDADALVGRLLGSDASVASLLPLIGHRTQGNPLFIEELVRQLEEDGNLVGERGAYRMQRTPDMRMIPNTVQAIIGARIDSRPELEKSVLQGAAVIGREFTDELLVCLTGKSSAELKPVLRDLSSAGLIHKYLDSRGGWAFKHPMMQEVAYRSMLSDRRRALHSTVAAEQQKCYPDPNGAQASLIAYHWEEAGNTMQAIDSNIRAAAWYGTGDVARTVEWDRVRDPGRALDAWKRVHRLLAGLSLEGTARQQLLVACGQILNFGWREGLTADDLKPYYVEALGLARSLGHMRGIVLLNSAYGRALAGSGSANDYFALANETLGMFASPEHVSLAILLTAVRCHASMLVGDLRAALADNDYVLANLDQIEERDAHALAYTPPVWVKYMRGRIFTLMGRYDEARPLLEELIASEEANVSAGHRIRAHLAMTNIAFGLGDQPLAKALGSAARRMAHSNRTPFIKGVSRICTGLELSLSGEYRKAMAMFGDALRIMRNPGLEGEAAIRCHLAHAQLRAGLFDASRATAEEAADLAERHGNKIWLTYAEWLLEGPSSPIFAKLVKETGAEHFVRLRHPLHERLN
jgi:class 3 adenylate cyclase/tetratricopeptide (TPR) repeat protein